MKKMKDTLFNMASPSSFSLTFDIHIITALLTPLNEVISMALRVICPGEEEPDDPGTYQRLYPIPDTPTESVILYNKHIQKTSHILANVVGVFTDWIQSFFDPNYFTRVRIRTQSAYGEFKSFMKNIYKAEKPFMVIDPQTIDSDDESIFAQNMINRYNMYDPDNDNIGAQLIYSQSIMKNDQFELVYRRNRFRFDFEILIMEQNLDRQLDTYNKLIMTIRHNSKFLLPRMVPHLLPLKYIQMVAELYDYDYKSETFLQYLNSISRYPIIRRISPNGKFTFYMQQEMNLQIEVPGYPNKDTPEMSAAIEWGARITDSFTIRADLPAEYLLLIPKEYHKKPKHALDEDPENISVISPVYADMDWPTEFGEYKLTNRIDIMVQEGDDHSLDIKPVIKNFDENLYNRIMECVARQGKLSDLVMVRVYPNGSYQETGYTFDDAGILTLVDPKYDKLYTANIYLNLAAINMIREGHAAKHIGTIDKY